MRALDKFRGCLLGGAAGDALGYEVEFMSAAAIEQRFGPSGITEYVLHEGAALISDDTQMTLFTAAGLLSCATRGTLLGNMGRHIDYISYNYLDWLQTQYPREQIPGAVRYSWLMNEPRLYKWRAPGMTCLSALGSGRFGTLADPINDSKGCGGIMRVAPIGLYFLDSDMSIEQVDLLGAEAAALTHGHELGWLSAAVLVHLIYRLADDPEATLEWALDDSLDTVQRIFPRAEHMPRLVALLDKARQLARSDLADQAAIRELGGGWVGEETLAIAVYCALKYSADFDRALIASVNHGGDSDSTGAVTGNIMGARLGLQGIPAKYTEHLELADVIWQLAEDLYHGCRLTVQGTFTDPDWKEKYVTRTWRL